MDVLPPPLSRTSSSASFSSSDDITPSAINASRRTRKRFTNIQLTMLENLFHQNSHPSREDREAVAKAGQMEIKSVTIWFQNKRQTERKSAANKESSGNRTASPTFSNSTVSSTQGASSLGSRPSLDRIASRTELRNHQAPRTPSRRHTTSGASGAPAIWDHMPSSPLVPPSPAASEYIDFTKNSRTKRTLEWACAAARQADKDTTQKGAGHHHHQRPHSPSSSSTTSSSSTVKNRTTVHRQKHEPNVHPDVTPKGTPMDLDTTEDEAEEAITPPSTWGRDDLRWKGDAQFADGGGKKAMHAHRPQQSMSLPTGVDDDDMMKAALALCGLGARRAL